MITLTEKAVKRIIEFAQEEGVPASIRLKINGQGCSGFVQDIQFDEIQTENDEVFEQDGVKILVDMLSIQYLDGSTIDYVEGEFSSGFKFNNPNVKNTCGCGSSISF